MEAALEAGAEDIRQETDGFEVTTGPADLLRVRAAMEAKKFPIHSASVMMIPTTRVPVAGEKAAQVLALVDALEDHDDVQNVYTNFDAPE
jgi:transcriptional/translational regulatory protein YebC/TACO1